MNAINSYRLFNVEPGGLDIVSAAIVKEPVLGRITNGMFQGREYVYVGGGLPITPG